MSDNSDWAVALFAFGFILIAIWLNSYHTEKDIGMILENNPTIFYNGEEVSAEALSYSGIRYEYNVETNMLVVDDK